MTATITWVEESGRITIARTFTSRSAAQAGLNALALVVESGFVPSGFAQHLPPADPRAERRDSFQFYEAPTPELHPVVEAIAYRDADESGPQMMDKAEAESR